jgi:hypothetical protein
MNSKLFSWNWQDAIKGVLVAGISAVVLAAYQALTGGHEIVWSELGKVAIIAALAYLIKNFVTNSNGQIGKER